MKYNHVSVKKPPKTTRNQEANKNICICGSSLYKIDAFLELLLVERILGFVLTLVMGAAGLDWPFNRATADDFRLPWPCLDIAGEYCS